MKDKMKRIYCKIGFSTVLLTVYLWLVIVVFDLRISSPFYWGGLITMMAIQFMAFTRIHKIYPEDVE